MREAMMFLLGFCAALALVAVVTLAFIRSMERGPGNLTGWLKTNRSVKKRAADSEPNEIDAAKQPEADPDYDVNVDPADHSTHLCPQDDCLECEGLGAPPPEGPDDA